MGLREHRPDAISGVGEIAGGGTATAPGKRAATERLPGRTGVPVVDDGTACERGEEGVCFLDKETRTRFLGVIGNRAGIIGDNARDAIADTRADVLFENEETWGPLLEIAFHTPTGWVIGKVASVVKASKYAAQAENVSAAMMNGSRGLRKVAQGAAAAAGSHQKASKARFLELVRDGVAMWQADLVEVATAALDDAGLVALKDALDPAQHTTDEFKAKLADMLARFAADQIDQVGVKAIYKHGELMYVGSGRNRRLVMLEDNGLHHLTGSGDETMPRDLVEKRGRDGKPIVIDHDLEPLAVALFLERTGREPPEMDVDAALAAGGEIARIVLDNVLSLGGAR
jgi:hypothetical protein